MTPTLIAPPTRRSRPIRKESFMAWAEKRGPWYRVRYRDSDGVVRTTPDKYRTKTEANEAAEDLDTSDRQLTKNHASGLMSHQV
jgi:hypothetical protein